MVLFLKFSQRIIKLEQVLETLFKSYLFPKICLSHHLFMFMMFNLDLDLDLDRYIGHIIFVEPSNRFQYLI